MGKIELLNLCSAGSGHLILWCHASPFPQLSFPNSLTSSDHPDSSSWWEGSKLLTFGGTTPLHPEDSIWFNHSSRVLFQNPCPEWLPTGLQKWESQPESEQFTLFLSSLQFYFQSSQTTVRLSVLFQFLRCGSQDSLRFFFIFLVGKQVLFQSSGQELMGIIE